MENYEVTVTQEAGMIQCDFKAAREYLEKRLEQYQGIIFTEDSKKEAKDTLALLRKEKKAFGERVKEVKEEYMAPFLAFAEQAKELTELYDKPISFISGQLADFEKQRVEEKKQLIRELYEECIGEMSEILPLARIYDEKWENAGTTQKAIRGALMTYKEEAKKAVQTIQGMGSEAEGKALSIYSETLDLSQAILFLNQHEQQKAAILAREQERLRREEEERIRREERQRLEEEHRAKEERQALLRQAEEEKRLLLQQAETEKQAAIEQAMMQGEQQALERMIPDMTGDTALYEYRMEMTEDQKEKLELFLNSVGIEWERM